MSNFALANVVWLFCCLVVLLFDSPAFILILSTKQLNNKTTKQQI